VATALVAAVPNLHAHPIHTSVAEVDYNRTSQKLEVALRVFLDDFEVALSALAGRPVTLATLSKADFDTLARAYLTAKFTVRRPDGALAPHEWVGREIKAADNELWLYFEIPLATGVEGARLHHALLGEHFPNQINSVRVRDHGRLATLVFLPRQTEKTVKFRPDAPPRK
jgi:hypothetical protein